MTAPSAAKTAAQNTSAIPPLPDIHNLPNLQTPAKVMNVANNLVHRNNNDTGNTKRANAGSARRIAELEAYASSSLSWMALEEWRITFFYTLFVCIMRGGLQFTLEWSAEQATSTRKGFFIIKELGDALKWFIWKILLIFPREEVFNGSVTRSRISPGFIFASSWVLLLGIWKRKRSHFDAQIHAIQASTSRNNDHSKPHNPPLAHDEHIRQLLIPSLPVRTTEFMLGRHTLRCIAVVLPVQFAASLMATAFLSRWAGPWLGFSKELLAEAVGPIVYQTAVRPFFVDLMCEIIANALFSMFILVLPDLCHLNRLSKSIIMPLFMWPLFYGSGSFLANVDGARQGSTYSPNILYALHCINSSHRQTRSGGWFSFLLQENLPRKQMSHILGPLLGGALGGQLISVMFPDPEKW